MEKNFTVMIIKKFLGFGFESNVYLVISDKKALIDCGTGFYNDELLKRLRKEVDKIDYIILTHEHFDHCGGAKEIKEKMHAKLCMHENGAEVLEKGLSWSAAFFNTIQPKTKVDIKLKEGDEIDLGNIKLKVIYTPGHSKGSMCLYERNSKSLFSGDTIFAHGDVGRTDFYGGNLNELIASIKKLKKYDIQNLYPGHGDYVLKNGKMHIEMAENMFR